MPGPLMDMEPVEPQSLKKLSFKSLKRALDLFSPLHGHLAPPDPASKRIRLSHKVTVEYGGIKDESTVQAQNQGKSAAQYASGQTSSAPSDALALPGPEKSHDQQKGGASTALVVGLTIQPKGGNADGQPGRSSAIISTPSLSHDRNLSTAAIMERIPSRWPRPDWHATWKNYRVISGHLGWVRSIAFDPSNMWFCTGSADRTIKIWDVGSGKLKLTLTT